MRIAEAHAIASNPGAYSQEQLRIAKLKLWGAALKAFPSSPKQRAIHEAIVKIHDALDKSA